MKSSKAFKPFIASGILLLGSGGYLQISGQAPCSSAQRNYATGFCAGSGHGTPLMACYGGTDQISFMCADGTEVVSAWPVS